MTPHGSLFISKTYTLHPVKNLEGEILPGSKYLIRLTVSLLNKSPNVQDLRYMGIFGGSAILSPKAKPKINLHPLSFTMQTAPWNRKCLPISQAAFSAVPRPASWKALSRT